MKGTSMSYKFIQSKDKIGIKFTVKDDKGNILPPNSPQFSISGDQIIDILSSTPSVVILKHLTRDIEGISVITYSVIGKNGDRINKNEEVITTFGEPETIESEEVEV